MFDVYVCTNHLSYLLTFKLSQDHLGRKNFQFMILLNGLFHNHIHVYFRNYKSMWYHSDTLKKVYVIQTGYECETKSFRVTPLLVL